MQEHLKVLRRFRPFKTRQCSFSPALFLYRGFRRSRRIWYVRNKPIWFETVLVADNLQGFNTKSGLKARKEEPDPFKFWTLTGWYKVSEWTRLLKELCQHFVLLQNQANQCLWIQWDWEAQDFGRCHFRVFCLSGIAARKEVKVGSGKMCLKPVFIVILGITYFS